MVDINEETKDGRYTMTIVTNKGVRLMKTCTVSGYDYGFMTYEVDGKSVVFWDYNIKTGDLDVIEYGG